jgi:WXG100 family type VII secretion target
MDTLHVRTAHIGALADNFSALAKDLAQAHHELDARIDNLVAQWRGEASVAAMNRYVEVSRSLEARRLAFEAAMTLAAAIEDTYARTDRDLARLFGDA